MAVTRYRHVWRLIAVPLHFGLQVRYLVQRSLKTRRFSALSYQR